MTEAKQTYANTIGAELDQLERRNDEAIAAHARLIAAISEGRQASGVRAITMQRAMDKVLEAMTSAVSAQRTTIEVHTRLQAAAIKENLEEVNWGQGFCLMQHDKQVGTPAAPARKLAAVA